MFGLIRQKLHTLELFLAFKCFMQHWDLAIIRRGAVISGLIFFGLIIVSTFQLGFMTHAPQWMIDYTPSCVVRYATFAVFVVDSVILLFVIWSARGVATAKARLAKKYKRWWERYERWLTNLKARKISRAEAVASKPIAGV